MKHHLWPEWSRWLPWQSFNEFFVSIVYFVQGSAGITGIAASLMMRQDLELNFLEMGIIGAASLLPWTIKPIFGLLTDLVPIGKFRRKPYLHIGPLFAILGYLLIAGYGTSFTSLFLLYILANLGLALTDVATDGFIVEESDQENVTRLQGITQASIRTASFLTAFFSGLLVFEGILTNHQMFILAAAFPCLTFIASFFVQEKPVDKLKLFESEPEESITIESSLEHYQSKKVDLSIFSVNYIMSFLLIFALIIANVLVGVQWGKEIDTFLESIPLISREVITAALWSLFGVWMICYFRKLMKLKLTTSMIFIALAFILLWRISPDAGSSMFYYVKDTLGINEKTIGFTGTIGHLGSIIGVILAVKYFDRFNLKKLLCWTVIFGSLFGLLTFAYTQPLPLHLGDQTLVQAAYQNLSFCKETFTYADVIGSNAVVANVGSLFAVPVYFFESLFQSLFLGKEFANPITTAFSLSPFERFLFLKALIGSIIGMIAYIPLLKLAILITPKKAEATNYAVIASIMNIGLAIDDYVSGVLYNELMGWYHPGMNVASIQIDVIEVLVWISIITSMMCLLVIPFLKTDQFEKT